MIRIKSLLALCLLLVLSACKEQVSPPQSDKNTPNKQLSDDSQRTESIVGTPLRSLTDLTSNYNTWWSYQYYQVNLNQEFIALDKRGKIITKERFLKLLTTQEYIPIQVNVPAGGLHYQLFKIPEGAPKAIAGTIYSEALTHLKHYAMEGKPFPEVSFITLGGENLSTAALKGRQTIYKTWFIACKPCVAEMPELNELLNDPLLKDTRFISLALDKPDPLRSFLKTVAFDYATVAEQKVLISQQLGLRQYPTHIVVDDQGIIRKVVNRVKHLKGYLNRVSVHEETTPAQS